MNQLEEEAEVNLKETLELQLSEVEMLQSMFPNPGEFKLNDGGEHEVEEIKAFLDNKIKEEYLESRIGFTIHITSTDNKTADLVCHLPHDYPHVSPEVFLRAPHLNRESHTQLNEDLNEFMASLDSGEICIGSIIQWLQENLHKYTHTPVTAPVTKSVSNIDTVFTRLWIYSHHIYSKFKRRDILEWASELKLTGFSMPGKPGVICIEGYSSEVDEFWYRLRRLNWKKIAIKEKENENIGKRKVKSLRKFSTFDEVGFDVRGGKGREYHMDLGKFYEFLEQHQCGKIFSLYFGVEGKIAS